MAVVRLLGETLIAVKMQHTLPDYDTYYYSNICLHDIMNIEQGQINND